MVRTTKDWPWSSYRATTGQIDSPEWLHTDWVLSAFAKQKKTAITRYKVFVREGKNQVSPWAQLKNQIFLGTDKFIKDMQHKISSETSLNEIPAAQKRKPPKSLGFYKKKYSDRNTAITYAYRSGGYSMEEIGSYFGLYYSWVNRVIRDFENAQNKT